MKIVIFITLLSTLPFIATHNSGRCREESKQEFNQDISSRKIVRRAAFDIGSGKIKVQISDVDLTANKIVNVLFTDTANVPLREELIKSLDGRLSSEIQNKTVEAISHLMKKIFPYHPENYHAIATESFRLAKNGSDLAKKIKEETGLTVTIVSQEEEGILGFVSAVNEINVDPEKTIVWDFGGGSFQITTKCGDYYSVYQGRLGKVPLKHALLKIQGKEHAFSPNPISKSDVNQTIQYIKNTIKDIPTSIQKKLTDPSVKVLGVGIHPLWGMPQNANYDLTRVYKEIAARLNLDDESIYIKDAISADRKDAAAYVVSNLILAYGVMEALGFHEVHYVGTPGANATGALLLPNYWKK
jgi:exopolyphosphatase / guanosine-5'-triphosphate,3'-diphosphate pyrophosphatase